MKLTILIICHADDLPSLLDALSDRYSIDGVVYTDQSTFFESVVEVKLTVLD